MYKLISFFLILPFIVACKKEKIGEDIPNNTFPIDDNVNGAIWQMPIKTDLSYSTSIDPVLLEDGIIVSVHNSGINESVKKFEKTNGSLEWEWNEYITVSPGQRLIGDQRILLFNDVLVGSSQHDHYGIDIKTGLSKWSTLEDYRNRPIFSFENSYFNNKSFGNYAVSDSSSINIRNSQTGECG